MVAISCAHAAHEADAVLHAHSVTWAAVSGDGLAVGEEGALRIAHAKRGHAQQLEARAVGTSHETVPVGFKSQTGHTGQPTAP